MNLAILRKCLKTSNRRTTYNLTLPIPAVSSICLFFVLFFADGAFAADQTQQTSVRPCAFSDTQFNPAADIHALENYKNAVAQLLKDQDLATLDCIADAARAGKTRFSGGAWKLHTIYMGLDSPLPGHPTEEDRQQHMNLVQKWRDTDPQSITARIALAKSYVAWAWDARGKDYAKTVSDSGWRLFGQRLAQAKTVLDEAASKAFKCPEWYFAMQQISLGQSWDEAESAELFNRAIALEPEYYYYYQARARYLQPKWNGEEGDPERFAKAGADRVGGEAGDITYFLTAVGISCGCDEPDLKSFSWPRLQRGFAALEKQYGPSLINTNHAALLASKAEEWEAADPMFKKIGDNWDEDVWITEAWFKQNRDSAAQAAPIQAKTRAFRKDAEANLKSEGGQAYLAEVESRMTAFEQSCVKPETSGSPKFQLFIEIGKDGSASNVHTEGGASPMAWCIMQGLYDSYVRKETPFPAPLKAPYAMMLEINPTTLQAATAK